MGIFKLSSETGSYQSYFLTAFGQILINLCVGYRLEISGASQHVLPPLFMSECKNAALLMR